MTKFVPLWYTHLKDTPEGYVKGVFSMVDFDKLNKETRDWNNGVTRNISPTDNTHRMKASDLLSNYNNYTYKQNNGTYSKKYF